MRISRREFIGTSAMAAGAWTTAVASLRGQGTRVDATALRQRATSREHLVEHDAEGPLELAAPDSGVQEDEGLHR